MSEDWVRHVEVAPGEFAEVGPYINAPGEAEALAWRATLGMPEAIQLETGGILIRGLPAGPGAIEISLLATGTAESAPPALRVTSYSFSAGFTSDEQRVGDALLGVDLGEPEPDAPTLEGLAAGLDDLLDGDDEAAAELIQLAETLDLSPSLGGAVWEALSAFRAAYEQVSAAKRQLETEIRRRGRRIVQADDIPYEALKALGTPAGAITADPTTRAVRLNPALGVPAFGRVTAEDLEALDVAARRLDAQFARVSLSREGMRIITAVDAGQADAPTLTRADVEAAQELRETIREKVAAAVTAGRRVNVLEVGNVEWCILGCLAHYPLELADGRAADLTIRRVNQERALSVYYDPEV